MVENMSLADKAVEVLAMVKAMDADMTNVRPERHQVRNLKRLAEAAIDEGLRRAAEFAWMAKDLPSLVDEVDKLARKSVADMEPVNDCEQVPLVAAVRGSPAGCKTPFGCEERGCLGWCDEHKPEGPKP